MIYLLDKLTRPAAAFTSIVFLLLLLVGTNTRENCFTGLVTESRVGTSATSVLPVLGYEQRGKSAEFSVAKIAGVLCYATVEAGRSESDICVQQHKLKRFTPLHLILTSTLAVSSSL
jgi:hypothetical protein